MKERQHLLSDTLLDRCPHQCQFSDDSARAVPALATERVLPKEACSEHAPGRVGRKMGEEDFNPPLVWYVFRPAVSVYINPRLRRPEVFWRGPEMFGRVRSLVRLPCPHIIAQHVMRPTVLWPYVLRTTRPPSGQKNTPGPKSTKMGRK